MTPSKFVKISNVWNRDFELTSEAEGELRDDFTQELTSVSKFKTLTVVRADWVRLGAELGSVFVEFWNEKLAQQGVKKVKGRIYDGCEIKTCYIEEVLFKEQFQAILDFNNSSQPANNTTNSATDAIKGTAVATTTADQ